MPKGGTMTMTSKSMSADRSVNLWKLIPIALLFFGGIVFWRFLKGQIPEPVSHQGTSIKFTLDDSSQYFSIDGDVTMTAASAEDFTLIPYNEGNEGNEIEASIGAELSVPPLAWPFDDYYSCNQEIQAGKWTLKRGKWIEISIESAASRHIVVQMRNDVLKNIKIENFGMSAIYYIIATLISLAIIYWDTVRYWL